MEIFRRMIPASAAAIIAHSIKLSACKVIQLVNINGQSVNNGTGDCLDTGFDHFGAILMNHMPQ